jgi:hypothetical protein
MFYDSVFFCWYKKLKLLVHLLYLAKDVRTCLLISRSETWEVLLKDVTLLEKNNITILSTNEVVTKRGNKEKGGHTGFVLITFSMWTPSMLL